MPIETAELSSGTRYYWKCPVCQEMSLPLKDAGLAEEEGRRHATCRPRR